MSNSKPEKARRSGEATGGVQSVDRAIRVLEILARSGGSGVSEVATDIGVHKSTAFRLLAALEDRGLVEHNHDRGKYQLGFGILRLASAIPARLDLVRQARPVLDDLAVQVGETVNLAVLREGYAVNLDQARGPAAVASHNWVGELTPLHATSSGKILLAHLDPDQREELLGASDLKRWTDFTVTSRAVLEAQLDQALANGYASTREEYELGHNAVAVPVRDHTGTVVGAVSASGPAYRLDQDRMGELLGDLKTGGTRISKLMGYLG